MLECFWKDSSNNVEKAVVLAHVYRCPNLIKACSDLMKGLVGTRNVINYLKLARQYDLSDLKEECLRKCKIYKRQGYMRREAFDHVKDDPKLLWETWRL